MNKFIKLFALPLFLGGCLLTSCKWELHDTDINAKPNDKQHCIKFVDDAIVVATMITRKGDTYEKLQPFFPVLNVSEIDGAIKYWDGDPKYNPEYLETPFEVYRENQAVVTIYSNVIKVS